MMRPPSEVASLRCLILVPAGRAACAPFRPVCYNCSMAKWDGFPDPVGEAFRRVSQDARARREASTPSAGAGPMDRVMVALFVLVLVLFVLGILALSEG